jgi:hypothetical protein
MKVILILPSQLKSISPSILGQPAPAASVDVAQSSVTVNAITFIARNIAIHPE